MMKRINLRRMAIIAVVAVLLLVAAWVLYAPAQDTSANRSVALLAPAFVSEASADPAAPANFLVEEAGMSAYMKSPIPIDLATVRPLYRTIEVETDEYIIGSIPVENYSEIEEVHVYVHTDGWVLGYYSDADPVSKIIDVVEYRYTRNSTTKLETVLSIVAGNAGVPFPGATFYDFRYPNASHMMFVVKHYDGGGVNNSFTISLPSSYGFFERSWVLYDYGAPTYFRVDGQNVASCSYCYGTLTAAQLLPDQEHIIEVDYIGALVLIYRKP